MSVHEPCGVSLHPTRVMQSRTVRQKLLLEPIYGKGELVFAQHSPEVSSDRLDKLGLLAR